MSCRCNSFVNVRFKRMEGNRNPLPAYQSRGAAGFDLAAVEGVVVRPGQTLLVGTGWQVEIQPGYEMQIRPRSGISLKTPLLIKNAPGTIDSDYRGEVCLIVHNMDEEREIHILCGDRIAQGVLSPITKAAIMEVEELSTTDRGENGLGSTGVKS